MFLLHLDNIFIFIEEVGRVHLHESASLPLLRRGKGRGDGRALLEELPRSGSKFGGSGYSSWVFSGGKGSEGAGGGDPGRRLVIPTASYRARG